MMPPVKEPLAGLALLVIFGFLIWSNRPIHGSPPFNPYNTDLAPRIIGQSDAYDYWLWKDPFGFDSPAIEKAIEQAVKQAKTRAEKKHDPIPQDLTCQASLGKIISSISNKGRSVKILAPLVKASPDTVENKELRTRQRYAVVAGLIESGYQPQEPGLLHFCSIQGSHEYDMRWEHYKYGSEDNSKPDIVVTWIDSEILTAEDKFPAGHPCTRSCNYPFKNLLKAISKDNELYLFDLNDILGQDLSKQITDHIQCIRTSRSDKNIKLIKLAGMGGEIKSQKPAEKPTGEPGQRDNKNANGKANEKTGSEKLAEKLVEELKLRGIKKPSEEVIIITEQDSKNADTLASDFQNCLARLVVNESGKYECSKEEPGKQQPGNSSGPAIPDEIRNVFYLKGSDGNPKKIRTQDKKDKNENQSADKPEQVSVIDLHQEPLLPIGPGQIDYFHRLAEEMRNVHDTVDFDKRDSGVKAVVILGSDFNDKLLIIEALRDKMPHLLILTTDLDAQMLYPKHWRSTRNLVVASHFDLQLNETLQTQFPPFRDSQQTNIFYRTLRIAEGDPKNIEESNITFPRIFEVGRNGFVRLGDAENNAVEKNNDLNYSNLGRIVSALMFQGNAEKNSSLNYHPSDNTRENTAKRLSLLFWIAVFLIWFHFAIRPWSGILSRYFVAGTLIVFAIAFVYSFAADGSGEPLAFTDGVSLWPTIFIQIIAVLLAVALFVRAMCELERNFCCLSRRYFGDCLSLFTVCPNENEPDECGPWLKKRRRNLIPWLRDSSVRGWITFLILIGTVAVYALNDVDPANFPFLWWCFLPLLLVVIIYIPFFWKDISIKGWREKDNTRPRETGHNGQPLPRCCILRWLCSFFRRSNRSASYESVLWGEYYRYGGAGYRIARVVAMWLFFAIIETLLVYLLPPWSLPCRGSTCGWASGTGVLSFTLIMLLLFFVLDAVRLNFYWIKKLRKQHPLLKERITQKDVNAYNQAVGPCSAESLENIVSMVATRTQAVDRLIYYPMLCIMLMLFAKITYFDNQDLPLSKALTFGVAISVLFFSGFMLRHEANQLKLSVKKRVQDLGEKYAKEKTARQIVKRIDAIDEGAFQPMLEQPVMQALLIVLASIGLFAGEYLKLFG